MEYIYNYNPYTTNNIDFYYLFNIENKIKNNISISNEEATNFLNLIIFITRQKINPNLDNFDNKCDLAQSILYHYFKNINCKIYPSMTQNVITNNIIGHSFLTLELNINNQTTYYLLDPTYIQFFKKNKCKKDNYYISPKYPDYILLTPDPGYFIKEEMKENCTYLLNHGHIELNEENAKMYGDSFYNTKTGTNPNTLKFESIPGEIFINAFTKGKERISKSEEELIDNNQFIPSVEKLINHSKKR